MRLRLLLLILAGFSASKAHAEGNRCQLANGELQAGQQLVPPGTAAMPRVAPPVAWLRSGAHSGTFEALVSFDATGVVTAVDVTKRFHPDFDRSMVTGLKRLRTTPAQLDGVPVPVKCVVSSISAG